MNRVFRITETTTTDVEVPEAVPDQEVTSWAEKYYLSLCALPTQEHILAFGVERSVEEVKNEYPWLEEQ
jgi:hypothetical protein